MVYSSGESDTEFQVHFYNLSTNEKQLRLKFLWQRVYSRARGASELIQKLNFNKKKIKLFGKGETRKAWLQRKEEQEENEDKNKCLFYPQNKFMMVWNTIGSLLLLYIALYMPIKTCFYDTNTTA